MFVVTVKFVVKPNYHDRFLPLMIENAKQSRLLEPGCQVFDVCLGEDHIFLYEIYDDKAAFAAHLDTAHYKDFDLAVSDMILSKDVQTFDRVLR